MEGNGFRLDRISYKGLLIEMLRNAGIILLSVITVWLGAAGVGKLIYVPQYTASATLVVSVKGSTDTYSSLSVANQMTGVFTEVFQSDALRKMIAEDVGEDVNAQITCSQIQETNLLVLNTTADDPRQAYLFIHSALKHYKEVSDYVFANASFEMVQEPSVPEKPSNSLWLLAHRNFLALCGGVFMMGVIFLMYMFRFTVKTSESASELLDGEILGVIPFERKKNGWSRKNAVKKSLLLNSPTVSMGYAESARRAQAKLEKHLKAKDKKVFLVTSIGENEGKSTVAANIALALAEKRNRVLLIDGDMRKPAQYKVFEEFDKGRISVSDVIQDITLLDKAIVRSKNSGILELFQYKEPDELSAVLDESALGNFIKAARKKADYIIIDCPPVSVAADAEMWMQMADTALMVVRQDYADVRGINEAVDRIWDTCKDFSGFVLNAFYEENSQTRSRYDYGNYQ